MYNIMHKAFSQSTIGEADSQARAAAGCTASIGRTRDGFAWTSERTTSGLPTKAVLPSKMTKQNYDVIVIGAGFAGLTAARNISQTSNLNVLVLEARDRIGGRTWTTNAFGMDFEMGGTWVHWYQPHVWSEIDRYNLSRSLKESVTSTATYIRTVDGSIVQAPEQLLTGRMEELEALFFAVDGHDAQTLMPYPMDPFREPALWKAYDHLTVRDRIDQLRASKALSDDDVIALEALNSGASLNRAESSPFADALRWYALAGYSVAGISATSAYYKIGNGGMTTLARRILNDYNGDILFDAVVSEIDQDMGISGPLKIRLEDGRRLSASIIISTIPLNVLDSIKFTPPLSGLRSEGIKIGHMDHTTKVHFKLEEPVEPYNTISAHGSDAVFATGVCDNSDPSDSKYSSHVVGFTFGKSIADVENSQDMIENFNRDLRSTPKNQVAGYVVHDWTTDPFSKGAWCSLPPGSDSRYRQEFQKPHGRVLFASGDWADGWMGFVDGAIEQGKRAALQVLAANRAR